MKKIPRSPISARTPLTVAITVGTVAIGMLLATPAMAADGTDSLLELSHDGVHYSPGAVQDIFTNTGGYVPGESRPGRVWIRNASADAAQLSLGIVNTDPASGSELPPYLNLQIASGAVSARAEGFPDAGRCHPMIEGWVVPGGESLRLDLNMGLELKAPNATRNQEANFDLLFVLQGTGGGTPVSPCTGAPLPLPNTAPPADSTDNVSVGTARISSATTQQTGTSARVLSRVNAGTGAESGFLPGTGTGVEEVPWPEQDPEPGWLWEATPQSNVVANIRSAWPWIAALSAGAYMVMTIRRPKRNA